MAVYVSKGFTIRITHAVQVAIVLIGCFALAMATLFPENLLAALDALC